MSTLQRRSKIVCTIGPGVASEEKIQGLILAGMNVARVNFSHGDYETHARNIAWIRKASKELHMPVAILGDLQGPKIRTSGLLGPDGSEVKEIPLRPGQELYFCGLEDGSAKKSAKGTLESPIGISYPRLAWDLRPGDLLLVDDGLVRFVVVERDSQQNWLKAKVEHGKVLGTNKGVNFPGAKLSTLGVTEKDWADILFALEQQIDFLALSFVRTAREVKQLKQFLAQKKAGIHVVAKIEKAEALEAIDEIIKESDALMVARGDLGVEIGNENVPVNQKIIIKKARKAGKPVITATQMLMSMVDSPTPSRAEASDVANAVFDGSDALMLSNETATGNYPIEAVNTMSAIIKGAEDSGFYKYNQTLDFESEAPSSSEAIASSAVDLAKLLRSTGLACLTRSGQAARLLAKFRPAMPIYAFAENPKVQKQLCLCWGVNVISWTETQAQDYTVFDDLLKELIRLGRLKEGESAIMTAGIPTTQKMGTTNTVVVRKAPRVNEL